MNTRRNFLGYATSWAILVLLGVLLFAVLRSCAPSADIAWDEREHQFEIPDEGDIVVAHRNYPVLIRRLTPEKVEHYKSLIAREERGEGGRWLPSGKHPMLARYPLVEGRDDLFVISLVTPGWGCVVLQDAGDFGDEGGFFDPCHGSHFDGLGRVRKGPAPGNLFILRMELVDENVIRLLPYSEGAMPKRRP